MIESCIKKLENIKAVLTDHNFLLVKKHLSEVLFSKDPTIDIGDGFVIHIPPHRGALYVVNETWGRNISQYNKLKGAKSILDVGGFVGDSALFFLKHGTSNVVVCEPNTDHYYYMQKNIRANKTKIQQINPTFVYDPYNVALVTDTSIDRECVGTSGSGINIVQPGTSNKIATIHVQDILGLGPFDGLKMDIEGGEFAIMERFAQHPDYFDFHQGYIEFHRVYQKDFHAKTLAALDFLNTKGYSVLIHDYFGNEIPKEKIIEQKKYPVVMIYFEKN